MHPGDLPGGLGIRCREHLEATGGVDRDELAAGRSHGGVDGIARAERLAASLTGAMATGERVRSINRGLNGTFPLRYQPVAHRKGALLIEAQLLCRRRGRVQFGHGVLSLRGLTLPACAQMTQDILGGRSRAPYLANVMEFVRDDCFVEVEKVHAFPRLYERTTQQLVQRRPRDGAAAESGDDRMHLRRPCGVA